MRSLLILLIAFLVVGTGQATAQLPETAEARLNSGERVRVIVWLNVPSVAFSRESGVANDDMADFLDAHRAAVLADVFEMPVSEMRQRRENSPYLIREMRYSPMAAIVVNRDELTALQNDSRIRRIEIDGVDAPSATFSSIGATGLADRGIVGNGETIAILDTGVNRGIAAFAGRWKDGACFSSTVEDQSTSFCQGGAASDTTSTLAGSACPGSSQGCGHGTGVGVIAAGDTTASGDEAGIAYGANIVGVQVFSNFTSDFCSGATSCALSYNSDQVAALEWLYAERERLDLSVINMSLGGGEHTNFCPDDSRAQIINMLYAAGIAVVAASGNDGDRFAMDAPACIRQVIAVGSETRQGSVSSFSNSGVQLDLIAPGEDIGSRSIIGEPTTLTGTSAAAPHVAGAIAMLQEAHPDAGIEEILIAIQMSNSIPFFGRAPHLSLDNADLELSIRRNFGVTFDNIEPRVISAGLATPTGFEADPITLTNTTDQTVTINATTSGHDWLEVRAADSPAGISWRDVSIDLEPGQSRDVVPVVFAVAGSSPETASIINFTSNGLRLLTLPVRQVLSVNNEIPANDNFADAIVLTGSDNRLVVSLTGTTREAGEPNVIYPEELGTIWWRWTPEFDQSVSIALGNSDIRKGVAVFTGDEFSSLELVDSDQDDRNAALVRFDAEAGTEYYIMVAGEESESYPYFLTQQVDRATANDDRHSPVTLNGPNGRLVGTTVRATADSTDPLARYEENSVWYLWVADSDAPVHFDIMSLVGSLQLTIYQQLSGDALNLVGQTNPEITPGRGTVSFAPTAGATYLIKSASLPDGRGGGEFEINWRRQPIDTGLRTAVLPGGRVVSGDAVASAFLTVINPAGRNESLANCSIAPPFGFSGRFSFRETSQATNEVIGNENEAFSLGIGQARSFVFSLQASRQYASVDFAPFVSCGDVQAAVFPGVNSFGFSNTGANSADVITSAISASGDGVARIDQGRATAVALAAVNIGRTSQVTLEARSLSNAIAGAFTVEFCATNPATGQCLGERAETLSFDFARNEVRTFTAFIRSTGDPIAFNPRDNRIGFFFGRESPATSLAITVQ